MEKKRVIKSMENISAEVMEMVKKKYPDGWANHVIRVNKGNNEFFHAITVDTEDTSYMVKVNVKVDSIEDLEKFAKEDDFGPDTDDSATDEAVEVSDADGPDE
jgi:hypothetical protein